jgi:hypothetical protein
MQMDAGLDTGDMCVMERLPIAPDDTTGSLHDKLAALGGRLIVEALEMAPCGGLHRTPAGRGRDLCHKIEKAESAIDWRKRRGALPPPARLHPSPGAAPSWARKPSRCGLQCPSPSTAARARPGAGRRPGRAVACGEGALRLTLLQRAGGKLAAADFLRGFELPVGSQLQLATPAGAAMSEVNVLWQRATGIARQPAFWGVRDMLGTMPGIAAWGLVTGVAMVKSGMSLPLALLMTLTVYAGSAQLAVLPLMAVGAPLWVVWFTAFCVNLRFVILSSMWRSFFRTCGCATGWRSATSAAT